MEKLTLNTTRAHIKFFLWLMQFNLGMEWSDFKNGCPFFWLSVLNLIIFIPIASQKLMVWIFTPLFNGIQKASEKAHIRKGERFYLELSMFVAYIATEEGWKWITSLKLWEKKNKRYIKLLNFCGMPREKRLELQTEEPREEKVKRNYKMVPNIQAFFRGVGIGLFALLALAGLCVLALMVYDPKGRMFLGIAGLIFLAIIGLRYLFKTQGDKILHFLGTPFRWIRDWVKTSCPAIDWIHESPKRAEDVWSEPTEDELRLQREALIKDEPFSETPSIH